MGGRGVSSATRLAKMSGIDKSDSEKLLNAPWQKYRNGNQVSTGSTIASAEEIIRNNKFETGLLVDKDGFVVAAYKGGRSSVDFGDTPATSFKGATITHNHPGGTAFFSVGDISTAAFYAETGGMPKSIRATTKNNGTAVLTATKSNASWNKMATAYNNASKGLMKKFVAGKDGSIPGANSIYQDWFRKNASKYGFKFTVER